MENRALINDEECEKVVLGTFLYDGEQYAECGHMVTDDCFYNGVNRRIWKAVKKIHDDGGECDVVFLMKELGDSVSPDTIIDIASCNTAFSVAQHVLRLRQLARQRRLWRISKSLEAVGYAEVDGEELDSMVNKYTSEMEDSEIQSGDAFINLADAAQRLYKRIGENSVHEQSTATKTGFSELDRKGGLQPNNLVIIAAESSVGKTSFANAIALNAIQSGSKVAYYSLEMRAEELAARFLSMKSGVSSSTLLYSEVRHEDILKVANAETDINCENLLIDDRSTSSIESILASIRRMKAKHDINGVVIDYLQILNVNTRSDNKEQAMAYAARRLKNIAKDLNLWVVALSQLNRDKNNPVPNLNRLRDSGQIAEAADIVLLLFRPDARIGDKSLRFPAPFEDKETEGLAMVDVAKGRNIGLSRFLVKFNPSLTLFYDIRADQVPDIAEDARKYQNEYDF